MNPKPTILILEDNDERIVGFQKVLGALGVGRQSIPIEWLSAREVVKI